MKTVVYRYQHKLHGVGPMSNSTLDLINGFPFWFELFHNHGAVEAVDNELFEKNFHQGIQKHHRFGCDSLAGLFDLTQGHAFEVLKSYDFEIVVIESEDAVVFPDGQVVFDVRTQKIVDRIEL